MATLAKRLCLDPSIRAYTIHDTSKSMYTVKHPNQHSSHRPNTNKLHVVTFKSDIDAIRVARLMEVHRSLHNEWPTNIFDESFDTKKEIWHPCRELFIRSWSAYQLQEWCKSNNLNVINASLVDDYAHGTLALHYRHMPSAAHSAFHH